MAYSCLTVYSNHVTHLIIKLAYTVNRLTISTQNIGLERLKLYHRLPLTLYLMYIRM